MRAPEDGDPPDEPPRPPTAGAELARSALSPGAGEAEQLGPPEVEYSAATEVRLELIEDDMLAGRFKRGRSIRSYAAAWGLSLSRVKELSAIASKRVLAQLMHPEEVARDSSVALRRIARKAERAGEYQAAIAAHRILLIASGAVAPKRTEALIGIVDGRREGETAKPRGPTIYVPRDSDD